MKKKGLRLLCITALLAALLCGCESAKNTVGDAVEACYGIVGTNEELSVETMTPESDASVTDGRKLIKTAELCVETENFDEASRCVEDTVTAYGGYIQHSDLSSGRRMLRVVSYTIRVPEQKLEAFLEALAGTGTIVSQSQGRRDVTLTYVDTQAHLTALRTEQESLLRLLEQAEALEDILTIQGRLTEVRYEIETYESQLRTYDDLIEDATVELTLSEVEREEETAKSNSVWDKIGTNLRHAVYHIGDFFEGLFIVLVSLIPYLLVAALIGLPIVWLAVLRPAKKRKKAREQEESQQQSE